MNPLLPDMEEKINPPCGGLLVDLICDAGRAAELKAASQDWPSWDLIPRQESDLELLLNGGFSPLQGFLGQADGESVCDRMELADGTLWPLPVLLDVNDATRDRLEIGGHLVLRDAEGVMLAVLHVEDLWKADQRLPWISEKWLVGGRIEGFQLPQHYDNRDLRLTPRQLQEFFPEKGPGEIAAFLASKPLHRIEVERIRAAVRDRNFRLLLHGLAGAPQPGDVDLFARVRCYRQVLPHLEEAIGASVKLALLALSSRGMGSAEVLAQALVARNFGCRYFFAPDAAATDFLVSQEGRSGVKTIPYEELAYSPIKKKFVPVSETGNRESALTFSEMEWEESLEEDKEIPDWFTWPEVAAELRRAHPPKKRQGFTVFFTGLSGSGKSTISRLVLSRLLEIGGRAVTLLDGDLVRKNLSSELGFSREHRILNVMRIGFVASEITKNGGIAICAPIAPYAATRDDLRRLISAQGGFILCHVATPLEVCEARDRKGFYAKARAGIIPEFTGISDPYEAPQNAELVLQTEGRTPEDCAGEVIDYLARQGYL